MSENPKQNLKKQKNKSRHIFKPQGKNRILKEDKEKWSMD